jgi:hypothetical protein
MVMGPPQRMNAAIWSVIGRGDRTANSEWVP